MPQELANILWAALGTIVTGLITGGFFLLRSWVSKKIGNETIANMLNQCLSIVENAVQEVFQIYVEALKKEGKFTEECHIKAKEMATDMIMNRLTPELIQFLSEHYGDVRNWVSNQIEAIIYQLKNK